MLGITTMVGVTLVARPPFLFGGTNPKAEDADNGDYYVGVALSVLCGASGSLMYVLAARCRKCPKSLGGQFNRIIENLFEFFLVLENLIEQYFIVLKSQKYFQKYFQ